MICHVSCITSHQRIQLERQTLRSLAPQLCEVGRFTKTDIFFREPVFFSKNKLPKKIVQAPLKSVSQLKQTNQEEMVARGCPTSFKANKYIMFLLNRPLG